jgi:hypothetical protein
VPGMAYYSQANSRATTRLLTALMLLLAAFGLTGSTFAAPRTSQTIVWARPRKRRAPRRLPEQSQPAIAPRPVCRTNARRDPWPPSRFFHRWLFQRPPPYALLSQA